MSRAVARTLIIITAIIYVGILINIVYLASANVRIDRQSLFTTLPFGVACGAFIWAATLGTHWWGALRIGLVAAVVFPVMETVRAAYYISKGTWVDGSLLEAITGSSQMRV